MGLAKKMEWLKWIRKYSTGILDTKTGSMETLIDSASSKTINYAYASSVIADDEFINAASPPHQRPMLPPPPTSQDSPSPPQLPNDVYDCCVSLDGIPIKQEFQYTLSDTDGYGKITQHDIEGLASKILESMYGTTLKFSSRGQRTVKVTLNVRQSLVESNAAAAAAAAAAANTPPSRGHLQPRGRDRKSKSSADSRSRRDSNKPAVDYVPEQDIEYQVQYDKGYQRIKSGAQRYRRDQLVEMVQRSLAENLSFQNLRKSTRPEGYHRTRTKRRQSSASYAGEQLLQTSPLWSSAVKMKMPTKEVAWSPYDFETVAHIPSPHHHRQHYQQQQQHYLKREHLKNILYRGQPLYGERVQPSTAEEHHAHVKSSGNGGSRHQNRVAAAVVSSNPQQQPKDSVTQEHTKNNDHQRYKRAKLASKKIHHHIHEHHHYHHYDYYIV